MEANYFDLPTILIYLFWIGFALLIIYIRREDKRVGYPLDSDREGVPVQGYPAIPSPRTPRPKHPALVGSATPMHVQPLPADAAQSAAFGDAAVGAAMKAAAPAARPAPPAQPAAPAPSAEPVAEPDHGHDHSEEDDR